MLVFKIFLLILIITSSSYLGILFSKKYANRVKTLKDMKNALNMFKAKIKFTYASIPEVFDGISRQIDGEVGDIFKNASDLMKEVSAGEAWNKSIEIINTSMTKDDKIILQNLGKLLGKTDIEGQISEIELVSDFLDTQIELAENERNKNEKMYKTLGGIIGLVLVIILI